MANRTVSVNLVANIGQYVSGMNAAAGATMRLGDTATASSKKAQSGFDLAGKGAMVMGAAVVGGLAMAISKSMDFEKSMSAVGAATQATGSTLLGLRDAAMKAGADTAYSATEAADAITEMGKAGVSAKDIMGGGLSGALSLAAAGQIDVAEAAGIASVAMTQFKLSGDQLPHVADLLAAGAGKAMGSVEDLGMALNQAGLVASSTGVSIEETTGTLAAFASQGLIGSDAGTSFKTMLQRLQNPSEEAAGTMKDLGINMYDASGQFVGMADLAGQLKTGMADLSQAERDKAMATIFGSDAVRAANVLYAEGADGIADWTQKVNDAGYAQRQAADLTDNLAGDLERLGGAFDTLMIDIGSGSQGPLRGLVQMLTDLVDAAGFLVGAFSAIPTPVLAAVAAFTAMKLLSGPMTGFLTTMHEKAVMGAVSLLDIGRSAENAKGALSGLASSFTPMNIGLGSAVALLPAFVQLIKGLSQNSADASAGQRALADALKATNGVIDENARAAAKQQLVSEGLISTLKAAGVSSKDAIDGLLGVGDAQDRVTDALAQYIAVNVGKGDLFGDQVIGANEAQDKYLQLAEALGMSKEEAEFFAEAAPGAVAGAQAVGAAAEGTIPQVDEAAAALEDWLTHLQQIGAGFVEPLGIYQGLLQTAAQATADATESATDSWSDYAANSSVSLDQFATKLQDQITAQENWRTNLVAISQRGGEEVAQILADMGVEGAGLVQQMVDANGEDFGRMRDLMIRDAQLGGSGAASALDQQMKVMAAIGKQGASATATGIAQALGLGVSEVAAIASQYGVTLAKGINPLLTAVGKGRIPAINGQRVPDFWDGGFTGAGGKYTPAGIVHKGEFVMPQEAVDRIGVSTLGAMAGLPGYARGGFVTAADVPHPSSTAPFQMPVSTAGDATMQKEYDETRAFVQAHMEPPASSGGSSTGLIPIMAAARQYVMDTYGIRNIGGFANRNIAGTNVKSDHAMGKAIDIMTTNLPLGWAIANDFASGPAHSRFRAENVIWQQSISSNGGRFAGMADRGSPTQNHEDHVHVDTYRTGTPYVPKDGLAYLHEGEAVVPKHINARSREFSGGGGSASGGSGAVNVRVDARVFVGNREITDIARVEATAVMVGALETATSRGGYNP